MGKADRDNDRDSDSGPGMGGRSHSSKGGGGKGGNTGAGSSQSAAQGRGGQADVGGLKSSTGDSADNGDRDALGGAKEAMLPQHIADLNNRNIQENVQDRIDQSQGKLVDSSRREERQSQLPDHIQDYSNRSLQEERADFTNDFNAARSNQSFLQSATGLLGLASSNPIGAAVSTAANYGVREFGSRPQAKNESFGSAMGRKAATQSSTGMLGDLAATAAGVAGAGVGADIAKVAADAMASSGASFSGSRAQVGNTLKDKDAQHIDPLDSAKSAMSGGTGAGSYSNIDWSRYSANRIT